MATKVIKIQIVKPVDSNWEELGNVLRELQYQTWKTSNKAIQMLWDYSNFNYSYKERFGEYINLKKDEIIPKANGKGFYKNVISDIRNQLECQFSTMTSNGKQALLKMVEDKWKNDFSDMINGRKSIANFKRDMPIELNNAQMIEENRKELMLKHIPKEESNYKYNQYTIDLQLINKKYATKLGRKNGWFKVALAVKDNYQKAIVDRVISGEYKLSMSKITYNKRKKKWFFNMAYTFTPEKKKLDKNKIMGIDVGVNIPAMLAISDDNYYRQPVGDGKEIIDFQNQVNARKRRLQRSRKWAGDGSIGHGVKTRIKPLDKLSGKIARFKDTKNHVWSRYIVDQVIKNNCGVIQMEDLSGISNDNVLLKTWTFYDLQQKIKYKSEENGIKINMIKPDFTSQRCNKCGIIDKNNRPNQSEFKCTSCDYGHKFSVNADLNAARNIAMKDIEEIIKEQLKFQEKELKNSLKYIAE